MPWLAPLLTLALLTAPAAAADRVRSCERRVEQGRSAEAEACLTELAASGVPFEKLVPLRARMAFYAGRLDDAAALLEGLQGTPDAPGAEALRRVVEAWRGHANDYGSREILRSGGVTLRWRRPLDEIFAVLLPRRLEAARARLADVLGADPAQPLEIVLAADRDDLAALSGLALDDVRAERRPGAACFNRVLLLSPAIDAEGGPWTENLAHQLALHEITRRFGPDVPPWLAEGVAQVADGRFDAPGGRRWVLPPEDVARRVVTGDPMQAARVSVRADAGLVGALLVRAVVRAHGRAALVDLLASGGTSLPRARLATLLVDEWTREARRPTFSAPSPASQPREESVERLLRLARLLLAGNHPHAALAELQKAHARERSVRTGLMLLPLAVQLGDWDTAGRLCDGLPRAEAEGYTLRFFCGQLRLTRQEYAAAADAFERAVDFQPYDVPVHQALQQVREQLQEARAKLDQALILGMIDAREEGP